MSRGESILRDGQPDDLQLPPVTSPSGLTSRGVTGRVGPGGDLVVDISEILEGYPVHTWWPAEELEAGYLPRLETKEIPRKHGRLA